jgi:hypothetical protein
MLLMGSAPAFAAITEPGVDIFASGSTTVDVLQNGSGLKNGFGSDWSGLVNVWTANPLTDQRWNSGGDWYQLTGDPTVTYTPTSTYDADSEFATQEGQNYAVDLTQDPVADAQDPPVLDGFISTDEQPDQRGPAYDASGGADEQESPIAQAPVALIFSLPTGVTIGAAGKIGLINNGPGVIVSTLQAILENKVGATAGYPGNTWGAFLSRAGLTAVTAGTPTATQFLDTGSASAQTGGYQPLELEVRHGDAPETGVLQQFMNISGDTDMVYGPSDAEENWPTDANDGARSNGYPTGPFGANTDGTNLVKNTLATPGTIGYALFSDAVFTVPGNSFEPALQTTTYNGTPSHQYAFAWVQSDDGTTGARHYAAPGMVETNASGALEAIPNLYTGDSINLGCSYSLTQTTGVGDWCHEGDEYGSYYNGFDDSDPAIYLHSAPSSEPDQRVNAYPIDEIAFDTGWDGYNEGDLPDPGFYNSSVNATDTGNTVKSYDLWVQKATGGQAAIASAKVGWAPVPSQLQFGGS